MALPVLETYELEDIMDLSQYDGHQWTDQADYEAFQAELMADLRAQLAAHDIEILKTLPNQFCFGVVAQSADGRFIHISIDDVRQGEAWQANVKLRRMSSERDWKGDEYHFCSWNAIGENAAKYLTAEFDDEIL